MVYQGVNLLACRPTTVSEDHARQHRLTSRRQRPGTKRIAGDSLPTGRKGRLRRVNRAVARAALRVIRDEKLAERSQELGEYFLDQLSEIPSPHVKEVRGRGLLIGVELKPEAKGARRFCEALQEKGILAKETHENVIRFAPPLVIDKETIDWALPSIREV